eukprot:NODE_326_length_10940_cov_0.392122.p6 type:complete len:166 gc:universal NODE_326_length_10940_cov_0.392122:8507-8010(-)
MFLIFSICFGFAGTFNAPLQGDIWYIGTEIKIEWLAGNTPVTLPTGYPKNLNIFCLHSSNSQIYRQITSVNPSWAARWIYNLPMDWASGTYKIQLCDSANPSDCILSPQFTVVGVDPPIDNNGKTLPIQTTTSIRGNYTYVPPPKVYSIASINTVVWAIFLVFFQ